MSVSKPIKSLELVVDNFGHIQSEGIYIPIKRFTWKNQNRVQVQAITYGALITSIKYPNKKGIIDDVVLGFDDMKGYMEHQEYYFGIVGRCANYIRHGHFILGKKEYRVTQNMGSHHYNGGDYGFDKKIWDYYVVGSKVVLSHYSPDGSEGFPGDMVVFVTYELTNNNEFRIDMKAYSTKMTIINMSNCIFFNLAGHNAGPDEMGKHDILINADCVTVTNEESLPTGEIKAVYNTMYDLQVPHKIGNLLDKYDGFTSNYCINRGVEQGNSFVSRLIHPESGRMLEIYSNQCGLQFETCNNLPCKYEVSAVKTRNPYLKNGVTTFELLDEIYNRVYDVMNADKSGKYNEIVKLIRELQKKEGSLFRTASGGSLTSKTPEKGVKRIKVNLDNSSNISLTPFQAKYVEKIVDKISGIQEPNHLNELRDVLEKVTKRNKLKDESSMKIPIMERDELPAIKDVRGKKGAKYTRHGAVCVMTGNYPDACNNINFPTCVIKPGTVYHHTITYKFLVKNSNIGMAGYM